MSKGNRKQRLQATAPARHRMYAACVVALMALGGSHVGHAQQNDAIQQYSIQAGSLENALNQLSRQSRMQIVFPPDLVRGKTTAALNGEQTWQEALRTLLQGSGLDYGQVNETTVVIKRGDATPEELDQKPQRRTKGAAAEEEVKNMPAIMVTGAKTLNMDITRTEDDPQPYVVFDREQIEDSGATSLEQFLQQRLTMNTSPANAGSGTTNSGIATSQITLRGLSASQTLILVDGHRVSSPAFSGSGQGSLSQADITGLPLGAIERIEILPTTASGIYGGSATGGVINIILRRDYTGSEARFTYENAFETDAASHKLDLTFGHSFNLGRTSLMVTANYTEANELLLGDRHFAQRGRAATWRNNPGYFFGPAGLPPLGATPNIASVDGSDLVLKDGTPLNAAFTSVPEGYSGQNSDGGSALVANAGLYNWNLAGVAQRDRSSGGGLQALYTQPKVKSGAAILRHQANERLQVFTDLSSSRSVSRFPTSLVGSNYRIPSSSPNNPFAQDIQVTVPLGSATTEYMTAIEHHRALAGLVWKLSHGWLLGADFTWDKTTVTNHFPNSAPDFANDVSIGDVDVLRDTSVFPIDLAPYIGEGDFTSPFRSVMTDFNLRASGPIGELSGGMPMLSASIAYRDEIIKDAFWFGPTTSHSYYPERSQTVASTYMEVRVPLFSERNARSGFRELDLQIAVRYDNYAIRSGERLTFPDEIPTQLPEVVRSRNTFASTDPTVSLRWKPSESLALRASYGTGFAPPELNQLIPMTGARTISVGRDPLRGGRSAGPFTLVFGGNADLKPEQSESWSAGLIFTPAAWPGLRLSLDYTKIKKANNIASYPSGFQGLINDESLFPGRILRGPNLPGDPPGWAGPITYVDTTLMNLASATLEAWDAQFDFRRETESGVLDFFVVGTWQPHYKIRAIDSRPEVENAGVGYVNPLKFKANAGVTWSRSAWRVGWSLKHFDEYKVSELPTYIASQGNKGRIPSQSYHDVFIKYDFGLGKKHNVDWLSGVTAQFGINNVFDKNPPFDAFNNTGGYYSRFGDTRLRMYYLVIASSF